MTFGILGMGRCDVHSFIHSFLARCSDLLWSWLNGILRSRVGGGDVTVTLGLYSHSYLGHSYFSLITFAGIVSFVLDEVE
jgi:hypothetical protein